MKTELLVNALCWACIIAAAALMGLVAGYWVSGPLDGAGCDDSRPHLTAGCE